MDTLPHVPVPDRSQSDPERTPLEICVPWSHDSADVQAEVDRVTRPEPHPAGVEFDGADIEEEVTMIGLHTLSPWCVNYNRNVVSEVTGDIIAVVADTDQAKGDGTDRVAAANALLLAAAPCLLESLQDVVDCWEEDAFEADGIRETHDAIYKAAKQLLKRFTPPGRTAPPDLGGEG